MALIIHFLLIISKGPLRYKLYSILRQKHKGKTTYYALFKYMNKILSQTQKGKLKTDQFKNKPPASAYFHSDYISTELMPLL